LLKKIIWEGAKMGIVRTLTNAVGLTKPKHRKKKAAKKKATRRRMPGRNKNGRFKKK